MFWTTLNPNINGAVAESKSEGLLWVMNGHIPKLTHKPSPSSAPFVQGGPLYQPGPKIARQVNYREHLFLSRLLIS